MCAPDCFSIFLRVSSPFPSRRHQFYRSECHYPDDLLFRDSCCPPTEVGFLDIPSPLGRKGTQSGKVTLHPADRQLCGTNRTPARRNRQFLDQSLGIGWDILKGRERSWGWVLGLSFCVWLFFYFCYYV
jgi:hypothetical protein